MAVIGLHFSTSEEKPGERFCDVVSCRTDICGRTAVTGGCQWLESPVARLLHFNNLYQQCQLAHIYSATRLHHSGGCHPQRNASFYVVAAGQCGFARPLSWTLPPQTAVAVGGTQVLPEPNQFVSAAPPGSGETRRPQVPRRTRAWAKRIASVC